MYQRYVILHRAQQPIPNNPWPLAPNSNLAAKDLSSSPYNHHHHHHHTPHRSTGKIPYPNPGKQPFNTISFNFSRTGLWGNSKVGTLLNRTDVPPSIPGRTRRKEYALGGKGFPSTTQQTIFCHSSNGLRFRGEEDGMDVAKVWENFHFEINSCWSAQFYFFVVFGRLNNIYHFRRTIQPATASDSEGVRHPSSLPHSKM